MLGAAGFIAGLMSLVYYDAWMKSRADRRSTTLVGPGAAAVDEFVERRRLDLTNPAIRLAFLIAIGIGVHNFGEGLAIGQAAAASEIGARGDADHRLRPAQRDRGVRDLRPAERRGDRPELAAARPRSA